MYGPRLYKNAMDCCVQSVRSEGYTCLTRGLGLTLVRAFPVNAVTWAVVTWTYRLSDELKTKKDAYAKFSDLAVIPDLALNKSYCAEKTAVTTSARFSDKEVLGRSSVLACKEDSNLFQQLMRSIPVSLSKM